MNNFTYETAYETAFEIIRKTAFKTELRTAPGNNSRDPLKQIMVGGWQQLAVSQLGEVSCHILSLGGTAAWVPDKSLKFDNNTATTEAREKISDLE